MKRDKLCGMFIVQVSHSFYSFDEFCLYFCSPWTNPYWTVYVMPLLMHSSVLSTQMSYSECTADYTPPSIPEVKNVWRFVSSSPIPHHTLAQILTVILCLAECKTTNLRQHPK
jgi:hypothetical protein